MAFDPSLVTDKTHFDPLTVQDMKFYAFKQIELSTAGMMIRELVKNAIEAAVEAPVGKREVVIDQVIYFNTPKLRIWNTGHAMDAEALWHMGNLACDSEKKHGLDENFGEGAKVAALRNNALGMIYTSCKDGIVSLLWLARLGENSYGRLGFLNDPRMSMAGDTILDVTDDYTEIERSRNWTQVVLLGKTEDQNTVIDPYGNGESGKTWLAHELYQRFFRIDPTIEITLNVGHNQINTASPARIFKTVENRCKINNFTDYEVVDVDGVKIHFIHDKPYNSNRASDKHAPLQSSIPFGGLIYKDEIYSVLTVGKNHNYWTDDAPKFGIKFGARNISMFVELPDDYSVVPETNRRNLLNVDRSPMNFQEQFGNFVFDNRPEWIKDLVTFYEPSREASMDEIQKRLREFMKRLDLRDEAKVICYEDPDTEIGDESMAEVISINREPGPGGPGQTTRDPQRTGGVGRPARNTTVNYPMFDITPLSDEREIAEKGIVGKAGKFIRRIGTLFVNMKYPAIDTLIVELSPNFAHVPHEEIVGQMRKMVEEEMIYRVCVAVARALDKQRSFGWTHSDTDKALEPECLSIAADGVDDDLGRIKQRLIVINPPRGSMAA